MAYSGYNAFSGKKLLDCWWICCDLLSILYNFVSKRKKKFAYNNNNNNDDNKTKKKYYKT